MIDWTKARMNIPMEECIEGNLYWIDARNSSLGIWDAEQQGFHIRRVKFSSVFRFVEYHWDTGPPYGTATPHLDLGPAPELEEEKEFLEYMLARSEELDRYCLGDLGWILLSYREQGSVPIPGMLSPEAEEIFTAVTGRKPGEEGGDRLDN
jgi:hypothetical protein